MKNPEAVDPDSLPEEIEIIHETVPISTSRRSPATQATPKGLPKTIVSLCPECCRKLDATLYEEDNKVYLTKTCPEHGVIRDCISSDAKFYLKMEKWTFEDEKGIDTPIVTDPASCPDTCGLCRNHLATACQLNIDLTNRCNLNCPCCFANANASNTLYEVSRSQIEHMLQTSRNVRPRRNKTIQYAGGEPTIHPDFVWAVRRAKEIGFTYVMVATNGLTFARNRDLAYRSKEAGLDALYLQFDGTTDEIYMRTRGRPIAELKYRAIENARAAGIRVVLVPTLIKGVNDHGIGDIIKYALGNLDVINGISFQPISFTGRIPPERRKNQRFTMADLAWAVKEQTGYLDPYRDWYPLSFVSPLSKLMEKLGGKPTMTISCHSDCGVGAYVISDGEGTVVPITQFVDIENVMMEINRMSKKMISFLNRPIFLAQFYNVLRRHYLGDELPEGFRFFDFLKALAPTLLRRASSIGKKYQWRFLIVLSMHFQDLYNYNLDRIRRCNVHYAAPNGRIYPFCTYNSGPMYREAIEREFARPFEGTGETGTP
ncbi:MAG: radical SAM protein [bacterium]|nr:MAG: radical SAM protein [bacterium]